MKIIAGILLVVVIALVVGFVPIMEVSYTEAVQYQDTETYYENEPYEVTEAYHEDEPYEAIETYSEAIPLSYNAVNYVKQDTIKEHRQIIIGGIVFQDEVVEVPIQVASIDVRNTDDIAGSFSVSFSGITPMFGSPSLTIKLDLSPGELKTAECPAEYIGNWSYSVTTSTKNVEKERTVTKYRQVEKERTVTKYRQVEKERTVTKERFEIRNKRVRIFEYLLSRFQP